MDGPMATTRSPGALPASTRAEPAARPPPGGGGEGGGGGKASRESASVRLPPQERRDVQILLGLLLPFRAQVRDPPPPVLARRGAPRAGGDRHHLGTGQRGLLAL